MKFKRYQSLVKPLLPHFYRLKHQWKFWWFEEHHNITLGRNVFLHGQATLSARGNGRIDIADGCHIFPYAQLIAQGGRIQLGEGVSVNPYCMLYGHGGLTIGNRVMIASHCTLIPANHRFDDPEQPIRSQGETRLGIVIEDDVWIASHVTVLDGVRIGTGSVIAAGAVVTKDIPPFSVAGGVPARVLKSRKPQEGTVS